MSAVIGGLITALFLIFGMSGEQNKTGNVTINEAPAPKAAISNVSSGKSAPARQVYMRDGPGVVSVDVVSNAGPAGGSGFVLDKNGHIITNEHVVKGASDISVKFSNGVRKKAEVVGEDPSTDIALLKVDAPRSMLKPLTLGNSDSAKVGDPVVAIGNPLNVGISVTTGIISAVGRPIEAPNNYTISGALQTDAAINPGNSGGPLLDSRGTVVGVNAQIASDTGSYQGIGFAIPINTVKNTVKQLATTGKVEHGYLGVKMFTAGIEEISAYSGVSTQKLTQKYGLPSHGAIVSGVQKGGPADKAGIQGSKSQKDVGGIPIPLGDVITKIDGRDVSNPDDVIAVVNAKKPGDRVHLTVVTPGKEPRQVVVKLGVQPKST